MKKDSISIPVNAYKGKDSKKYQDFLLRIKAARAIENYIRSYKFTDDCADSVILNYDIIAFDLSIQRQLVAELLMGIGGGAYGITLDK